MSYREPSPPPPQPPQPAPPKDWTTVLVSSALCLSAAIITASYVPYRDSPVVIEHVSWTCEERLGHSEMNCGYGYNPMSGRFEHHCSTETVTTERRESSGEDIEVACPDTSDAPDHRLTENLTATVSYRETRGTRTYEEIVRGDVLRGLHPDEACAAHFNIFGSYIDTSCP